jgi:hypothetical protein
MIVLDVTNRKENGTTTAKLPEKKMTVIPLSN